MYILNPDSTVSTKPVTVARTQGDNAIIATGVEPGDVVITDGQIRLSPGAKVVVRSAAGSSRGDAAGSAGGSVRGRAATNTP